MASVSYKASKPKSHKRKTYKSNIHRTKSHKSRLHRSKSPSANSAYLANGIPVARWTFQNRKYWLTIKDIMELPPGRPIKVLALYPDIFKNTLGSLKHNTLYNPSTFFKDGAATFWRNNEHDLTGSILFKWQKDQNLNPVPFEFYVEQDKKDWHPLDNGVFRNDNNEIINWNELSSRTHVGWQGPMMFWNDIDHLPKVYKKK